MTDKLDMARSLISVVRAAGDIELRYFNDGFETQEKKDGSPVTLADQEAEDLIARELNSLYPDIPMVGEESVAAGTIPDISKGRFFLVDPLDGTKEFVSGGGDFTVNIALLENFRPVMGIIFVPTSGRLYYGASGKAFRQIKDVAEEAISVRSVPDAGMSVVTSKRHGKPEKVKEFVDGFAKGQKVAETKAYSSSLKFCAIAEGDADLYPRLGPTCEWDTAAGDAILQAAGGRVLTLQGDVLPYGKVEDKFLNPEFVAVSA